MSEVNASFTVTPITATIIVDNNQINLTPEATQLTIINGYAGISGYSGVGTSGYSGTSGAPGASSGYSGKSGYSGISGDPGGTSGWSGRSGYSGVSGLGLSGYSGISGAAFFGSSGWSGTSGISGYSGVSYLTVPQTIPTTTYSVLATDSGKHLYHAPGSAAGTYIFPANSNVAFSIGTTITIVNQSANTVKANITSDTLLLQGNGASGNRVVGSYGGATLIKVANTTWAIMGTNIT